ncbi:MAG: glycosyltransferase [Actinobacteria bacterium]|nr:glycosyltransferase [Actinomycetota bacterium]
MSSLGSYPPPPVEFALVSEVVPPSWSGQAVLIRRLVTGLDPRAYCLLTSDQGIYAGDHIQKLETTCYRLPAVRIRYLHRNKWLFNASAVAGAATGIARRAVQIARVARREQCRAILVFTGDFHDLPAAYLASRLLRLRLYVYMCDYYSHREAYEPARRRLSPHLERIVVRGATRVICGTDTLADALADRYGVAPAVIHHPADLSLYALADRPHRAPAPHTRIVYTGTIYEAQLDAVQNLLAALDRLSARSAALHVYGGQLEEELRTRGLDGRLAVHGHASAQEIAAVQEGADILFLPLAFRSQYPEVIRTSAPMKFGEYLAAGGPILVHAPPDAFVSQYCRRHDCAIVVDEPDPSRVAEAIEALCDDAALRARLIRNAQTRARSDFGIDVARARFGELLHLGTVGRCTA